MYLRLAWRNIWRNKTRTFITAASIFLAVLLCSVQSAIQAGTYERMIQNVAGFYTGYLQVHKKGYWNEKILDNAFAYDAALNSKLTHEKVENLVPRLETFALVSSDEKLTKGALISGIDPEKENSLTHLKSKLIKGNFLQQDDNGILLPEGLAKKLKVGINDTVVVIGQGYHGSSAAGKYPIRGIVKFATPELNDGFVYLPIKQAQILFSSENLITSLVVNIRDQEYLEKIYSDLRKKLDQNEYEVMDWQEMLPDLVQGIAADKAGAYITKGILYMIMTFGIFGTVLMMTAERMYEFGVLISIGMGRGKLAFVMIIEIILISLVGVTLGMIISVPVSWYFKINPITLTGKAAEAYEKFGIEPVLPASTDPLIFFNQGMIVFIVAVIIGLYPTIKIMSMDPVKAMKR